MKIEKITVFLPLVKQEHGKNKIEDALQILEQALCGDPMEKTDGNRTRNSKKLEILSNQEELLQWKEHGNTQQTAVEIVITDEPEMAYYCQEKSIACIMWLHENNQWVSLPNGMYCVENLADISADYAVKVYQRVKNLPWIILETKRLRLREITVADVPRLYELYQDASITSYMENLFPEPEQEIAYTKDYIKNVYRFYGYGMWIIEEKQTGEVIGRAGIESKPEFEELELGFMLGVAYQHKGYAYEICTAILQYAQEELEQNEFVAQVHQENTASVKLCEKLGFHERKTGEGGYLFYALP